jgi:DNA mismatch repair protein MutL
MVITALPESTVRLLGSAQALTSPTSLVKELIDNAIDAHATSIDVLISPNTLDKIEVRDNGHGIPQDDLDALGRRGHTSKLRTFEDLKAIGGASLGFRGEALASAVQLGEVSVTSRTDGEPVASLVKLKPQGGIASQTRTSHPVGTTVSVTKFMSKIPVRKQVFERAASKSLMEIKELLQGYSLARCHIRFVLKIAKGGKGSWSFAPRPNDGIKEAVSQIINRNLAVQYIEKSLIFNKKRSLTKDHSVMSISDSGTVSEGSFTVEAFLPKPDADLSNIGHRQFISIDSRPVAHDKGTMRKIITMFRHYTRNVISESSGKLKTPFLRLNIKCPESSYDLNVEPAKDDVLFEDESLVLESIEGMFKSLYGDLKVTSSETAFPGNAGEIPYHFNILLARKQTPQHLSETTTGLEIQSESVPLKVACEAIPVISTPSHIDKENQPITPDSEPKVAASDSTKRKWGFDMSEDYSEKVKGSSMLQKRIGGWGPSVGTVVAESTKSSNGLNPWLIAKMDAPFRASRVGSTTDQGNEESRVNHNYLTTTQHLLSPTDHNSDHHITRQQSQPRKLFPSEKTQTTASPASGSPFQQHETAEHGQADRGIFQPPCMPESEDDFLLVGDDPERYVGSTGFVSARYAPVAEDTRPTTAQKLQRSRGLNKPFVSPLKIVKKPASADNLRQTTLTGHPSTQINMRPDCLQQRSDDELAWAMDYENRKDNLIRRRREERLSTRSEPALHLSGEMVHSSPHKNRYNAAIANLEGVDPSQGNVTPAKEPFQTSLPDGDPRAYLMRRQKSMLARSSNSSGFVKLTRAKSMRLPLETIPNREQLHDVLLRFPTDILGIYKAATVLTENDTYVSRGNRAAGLTMSPLETTLVATRVEETVNRWLEARADKNIEVLFHFENLISDML